MCENDYFYTIMRTYYGLPDYFDTALSKEEDCFCFDTEEEAETCLKLIFDNGEWMEDMRYGKVRYYVTRRQENRTLYEY